ncbi:MAG: SPOR domain-containing protein [Cyanobacteria bacterium J06636_27]
MINTIFNPKRSLIHPDLTPSFLSGIFLALVSITPIQAQTPEKSYPVAQLPPGYSSGVYQEQTFTSPFNNQYQNQYQYSQSNSTYSANGSYFVVVDNFYSGYLQQVRSVAPDAFIPPQRPSVIQVGSFNRLNNAQQMAQELQRRGFNPRIESQNSGIGTPSDLNNPYFDEPSKTQNKRNYYVVIPQRRKKLSQTETKIRQSLGGNNIGVAARKSPRGYHVAVGPFTKRSQAEQWKYYLRSLGLSNGRVYYGK